MWFCEDFLSGPTFPGFSFKVGTTVDCLNTFLCPLGAPVSALHRQFGDANLEMCPNWAVFSKLDCPTMRADQFLRDGKPKTSAVTACRSLESREKIVACFLWQTGAGVLDTDDCHRPDSSGRNRESLDGRVINALITLHGLHRIPAKIAQHAEQLL